MLTFQKMTSTSSTKSYNREWTNQWWAMSQKSVKKYNKTNPHNTKMNNKSHSTTFSTTISSLSPESQSPTRKKKETTTSMMDVQREATSSRRMNSKRRKETLCKLTRKNQQSSSRHTTTIIVLSMSAAQVLSVKTEMRMAWMSLSMLEILGNLINLLLVTRRRLMTLAVTSLMFTP